MKKKLIFILIGAIALAFALGATVAYFSLEFSSTNNTANAAAFDVDVVNAEGETIGEGDFNLGEDLYPGVEQREVYTFNINKNNTELPVEYGVNLSTRGALFPGDGNSPILLTLERKNIDGEWEQVNLSSSFMPEQDTESYRILVSWPHGDNDIAFQGATGEVALNVTATQIDGQNIDDAEEMVRAANEALTGLDKIKGPYSTKFGTFSRTDSDAVQLLIDVALEYVNGLTGEEKSDLLSQLEEIQNNLNEKIEERYVYVEMDKTRTNFTNVYLNILSDDVKFNSNAKRFDDDKVFQAMGIDSGKTILIRYFKADHAEVGDTVSYNLRFFGAKDINVTFTNLGEGNWKMESDWLVER